MEAPSDRLLASDVFEPRAETGSKHFAYQGIGLFQISKLMVSSSENLHNNINVLVWRQVKQEKSSLPVAFAAQGRRMLKLPNKWAVLLLLEVIYEIFRIFMTAMIIAYLCCCCYSLNHSHGWYLVCGTEKTQGRQIMCCTEHFREKVHLFQLNVTWLKFVALVVVVVFLKLCFRSGRSPYVIRWPVRRSYVYFCRSGKSLFFV